ncbi:hypothetical protein [Sulfoacidibacillus ferrooxidans]|uniref:Uncharacterized protein n=1 Tax=Sulfoacidibacillus ferrooxidans TaxID=2005001 RepID=A0A9X2AF74_9BACL|nr:hypothetical protein [Sulfoacidibacillus ferrooxidans]MCI0183776.1 hypothetical protein [Sulfoacidibacillus ferrooxidans]
MNRFRILVFCSIALSMVITGCATVEPTQSAGANSPQSSVVSKTQRMKTTTTSSGSTNVPVEMMGLAGSLYSTVSWPFKGEHVVTSDGMQSVNLTDHGFTIGGVSWLWPSTDQNSAHYIVVPTTIKGKPFLVWCHLASLRTVPTPVTGSYTVNQLEATGPSQLWMTPWRKRGGSLQKGAILITNDIPPVWSTTGQYVFPRHKNETGITNLAGGAYTGWFQWGSVKHPPIVAKPNGLVEPTVAFPVALYAAHNGVVLSIRTQMLFANQGTSTNLYDINLAQHKIHGLASLTAGGGLFFSMRVVSGLVLTSEASDLATSGTFQYAAYAYNEQTGDRTLIHDSPFNSLNGFQDWSIKGDQILDADGQLAARINIPQALLLQPAEHAFR